MVAKNNKTLDQLRQKIDELDNSILDILEQRNAIVSQIQHIKVQNKISVIDPERERRMIQSYKQKAAQRNLDIDWAENMLRLIFEGSRAKQSKASFPMITSSPQHIIMIGGKGSMASIYRTFFERSGHVIYSIDVDNWSSYDEWIQKANMVIVSVPIATTVDVIKRIAHTLPPETILADFTSIKSQTVPLMLNIHSGPVVGLHPMHAPDLRHLSKQLLIYCPGRRLDKIRWFFELCKIWGMRLQEISYQEHDILMSYIQGLRHFNAFTQMAFLYANDIDIDTIIKYSSPIYRTELIMNSRLFAQDPDLYADIIFSSPESSVLLDKYITYLTHLKKETNEENRATFIKLFEEIRTYLGPFAENALKESTYLTELTIERNI